MGKFVLRFWYQRALQSRALPQEESLLVRRNINWRKERRERKAMPRKAMSTPSITLISLSPPSHSHSHPPPLTHGDHGASQHNRSATSFDMGSGRTQPFPWEAARRRLAL